MSIARASQPFIRSAVVIAALWPLAASAALFADDAGDLCAPAADPCIVSQEIAVADGSLLDLGARTLKLQGAGVLDFGAGDAAIRCGRFEAVVSGAALKMRGSTADGSKGGEVTFTVTGAATLDGAVSANADSPGRLRIETDGDIALRKNVSIAASRANADGGTVELVSRSGSVLIEAPVDASGGGLAAGGQILVDAGNDIVVDATLTAAGGDDDGGTIALLADRDIAVHDDLRADALGGAGFGGEIDLEAGRDLVVAGGGAANNLALSADGHQSVENYGGDGGSVSLEAGRDLALSRYVHIGASGAAPDGFADTVAISAAGTIAIDGGIEARGRGASGGGGVVEIDGDGDVRLSSTAVFDLRGAAAGGDVDVACDGSFDSAATIDVSGGSAGVGGRVVAVAGADATIGGSWKTGGADNAFASGDFLVEACHVAIGGSLANSADGGSNSMVAHEGLAVAAGASVSASGTGAGNVVRYRSAAKPPLLQGAVSPAPEVVVDGSLASCPVCGNGELDAGESCDDGNLAGGDGCSVRCQDEACEADSAGGELCSDDNPCTLDACDGAAHRCDHAAQPADCDDGDLCTVDETCHEGSCLSPSRPALFVDSLKSRFGAAPASDRLVVKAGVASWWSGVSPIDVPLRIVVSGPQPLADLVLPAGSFTGRDGVWKLRTGDGSVSVSIRAAKSGGNSRVKLRLEGLDLQGAAAAPALRLTLLLGDDAATGSCASSGALACVAMRATLRCAPAQLPFDERDERDERVE